MAKTFLQLKDAVEDKTGTNSETGQHLNDGLLELAMSTHARKRVDVTATDGVIAIPADCLAVKGVYWNGYRLDEYRGDEKPDLGTGTPYYWQLDGSNVNIYPKATGTAQLIYIERPAEMTQDADTPSLPDCDKALIAYAIWQNYFDGEDEEEALYWEQKWLIEKAKWMKLDALKYKRPRRVWPRAYA